MDNKQLGAFIAEMRKQRGYTQKQLADMLFVTDKAVSRWECGLGFPDVKTLQPLSETLGVSLAELLDGKRYEAETVPIQEANRLIATTLHYYKAEISTAKWHLRTMLLLGVVAIFFVLNLALGYVFEWMQGNMISVLYPFYILRFIRHIVTAIALLLIGLVCLRSAWRRWAVPTAAVCSAAATLCSVVMLASISYFFPDEMTIVDYIELTLLLLATACIGASIRCLLQHCGKAGRLLLLAAGILTFVGILIVAFHPGIRLDVECVRALSLSSPMILLSLCMRMLTKDALENLTDEPPCEKGDGHCSTS